MANEPDQRLVRGKGSRARREAEHERFFGSRSEAVDALFDVLRHPLADCALVVVDDELGGAGGGAARQACEGAKTKEVESETELVPVVSRRRWFYERGR